MVSNLKRANLKVIRRPTGSRPHTVLKPVGRKRRSPLASKPPQPAVNLSKAISWSIYGRNGAEFIKAVSIKRRSLAITGWGVNQAVLIPLPECDQDKIDNVVDMARISFAASKRNLVEYRALIMKGEAFIVTSGSHSVLLDRHEDCPHGVIDEFAKLWAHEARSRDAKRTGRNAKLAAENTIELVSSMKEVISGLKSFQERHREIGNLLEELSDKNLIPQDLIRKVNVLWGRAGADAAVAEKCKKTENNLDRTDYE